MQKRWLINLVLLLIVAGLVAFVYLRPQATIEQNEQFEVSAYKLAEFDQIQIDFPAKAPVNFKKVDEHWRMTAPHNARADRRSVLQILSLVAARTEVRILPEGGQAHFSQATLEKYGLVKPNIKLSLIRPDESSESFLFGNHNPITEEQYIAHNHAIFLLPVNYAEVTGSQTIELISKAPLAMTETVTAMDLSHLEQWEATRMKASLVDGEWQPSLKDAVVDQVAFNEWFTYQWQQAAAESVKLYTPKQNESYPYIVLSMSDGKKVRFDKMQESPKLLLGKPDEGVIYTFPADAGFAMLNPPISAPTEE